MIIRRCCQFAGSTTWRSIEKMGGGAVNCASTSTLKQLMKALAYLMGQRRVNVPKALTREIVEAVCGTVRVTDTDEMTAASMLVADFVWGARAANKSGRLVRSRLRVREART